MEIEIAHQYRHHTSNNNNAADVEIGGGACLAWEDLTAVLPNFGDGPTKRLINGLTGYALPGRILAVMGPSGSGKSTFLDSLTGRLAGNVVMSGNIILNGKKQSLHYGLVAYVTQEDELLGTLTVRETIKYSALLRLPSNLTKHEINDIVDQTITDMGLEDCADTLIGNWHLRGISGGEKKRLSIALEMITQPYLLFLDEPTSGLDSASAFFVIQGLKNVAASGRTIISTVHQPSSEVFALFDDLLLLSLGETVYFGDAKMALEFFADAGFPCPGRRSPSDHFLRCVNSDFDELNTVLRGSLRLRDKEDANGAKINSTTTTEIRIRLIQKYHTTKLAARAKSKVQGFSTTEGFILDKTGGSRATWTKQLWTLTKRSFKNMYRDFGYYWLRIIVYIIVSLCTGSVFYNVGSSFRAVYARGAAGGFISGFMTMMSIGGFPSFVEEMKIFHKERRNGHYGVGLYILSNIISSFPFIAIMSFSTAAITYFMVKFHPGFFHFFYVSLVLLLSISVVESCMMVIASLVPNYLMGVVIGAGFIGTMMASAGFFRSIPLLPKVFWTYPVSYLNYMAWALQGAYKNDMIGLEFESEHPGEPKLKGEDILNKYLGVSLKHSKWWDLAVVACILIAYRLIFFLILKLKERALPMLRTFYANVTLHQMKKRPSFRKTTSPFPSFRKTSPFPSLRHQVAYPLSSQEGLNSPLH